MGRSERLFTKKVPVGRWKHGAVKKELPVEARNTSVKKLIQSQSKYEEFFNQDTKYDVINLFSLANIIENVAVCKECGGNIKIRITKRVGLAIELCVSCSSNCVDVTSRNSELHKDAYAQLYTINTRFVYALRCIGKGMASGKTFCGVMNLPPPPSKFNKYVDILCEAATSVSEDSMGAAVQEAVDANGGCRDISVALDGTWQKRGYVSLNGVVTATSFDTGKVIDLQIYSKYCRCPMRHDNLHKGDCSANFNGTSGAMEVAGAKAIFERSLIKHNLRYINYLGDGDSKAYSEVVAASPYGSDVEITKLECVGHVQKRMGTRLRTLKMKSTKLKLSDGKGLSGKNRLTDATILQIQKYYGLAIKRNLNDAMKMKHDIWAEYFHLMSDNENPQHGLCPEGIDSWCKFRTAEATAKGYDHTSHLHIAPAVMERIKPIFKDLADTNLLQRCVHGHTQNPNESVNNIIWSRVPKNTFLTLKPLTFGIHEAVSSFNNGNVSKLLILKAAGIEPGLNCVSCMEKLDKLRASVAVKKQTDIEKKARQKRSKRKKNLEEDFLNAEEVDKPSYCAGFY